MAEQQTAHPTERTPILTPRVLASRWDMSQGHLANLRSEGSGPPYVKLGSRILYRLEDVENYEAARLVLPGTRTRAELAAVAQ